MDGLLVDSERITREACKYAGKECGVEVTDDFYGTLIGKGGDDSEKALLDQFGSDFQLDTFMGLVYSKMQELFHVTDLLKKGAREIIEYVHEQGLLMGLVTSSRHDDVSERVGLFTDYFSVIVTREDVRYGKPSPDLYLEALHRLNLNSCECIVFEDSPAGTQAAINAGIRVIIVPDLVEPDVKLREQALAICSDLSIAREYLASVLK